MSSSEGEPATVDLERFIDLAHIASRPTMHFAGDGFDPLNPPMWNQIRILVVGAGGLGCELLHCLALLGFSDLECIDMDTIDLSNLNRQFLFRSKDIGKPKADVAAAFINRRFPWVNVVPHFGRIEEKADDFYRSFHMVIMGLDSISARKWMNDKLAALATYTVDAENGMSVLESAIPIIDGGTEGFRGSARHISFGKTACIECSMYLYPPAQGVPMCTIENVPRVPEHCVLYAKIKKWEEEKPFGVDSKGNVNDVDGDNADHILWIAQRAQERQAEFKIEGTIDFQFTQGVVKNVIPAVGFTNAMIAAMCAIEMCAIEALKLATGMVKTMDNYTFYDGGANGVASYTQQMYADPECPSCQAPKAVKVSRSWTPRQVVDDGLLKNLSLVGESDGKPLPRGAEVRLVISARGEDGPCGVPLLAMLPSTDPRSASVAPLQNVPLLASAKDGIEGHPDTDSEQVTYELEVSGGLLGKKVVKCLVLPIDEG